MLVTATPIMEKLTVRDRPLPDRLKRFFAHPHRGGQFSLRDLLQWSSFGLYSERLFSRAVATRLGRAASPNLLGALFQGPGIYVSCYYTEVGVFRS
jgi:hypothetical protein